MRKRELEAKLEEVAEQAQQVAWSNEILEERLVDYEFAREDRGWLDFGVTGGETRSMDRSSLAQIIERCRLYALRDPLVKRGVRVRSEYVFGQGVTISAADPQVQEFAIAPLVRSMQNRKALFGHGALLQMQRSLDTDANVFLALWTNETLGTLSIRSIPVEQITRLHRDPNDSLRVWFYERTFSDHRGRVTRLLHPALDYMPSVRVPSFDGARIEWSAPVVHVADGSPTNLGLYVPDVWAALDWAQAYRRFLEDFASIARALSRFAWKWKTQAGKTESARTSLGTTIGTGTRETNPPPPAGSMWIEDAGGELSPISAKSGATIDVDSGKPLRLMAGAAIGLPDHMLSGDADQGTLATAKSLDRPTELTMGSLQRVWGEAFDLIAEYQIEVAIRSLRNPLRGRVESDGDGGREIMIAGVEDPSVETTFPPILEHDVGDTLSAISTASDLAGVDARTILRLAYRVLGVDNVDEIIPDDLGSGDGGEMTDEEAARSLAAVAAKAERYAESLGI